MKLYTEEQVKRIYEQAYHNGTIRFTNRIDDIINYYTPIELPSDEEIEKLELEYAINFGTNMGIGFKIGCQWMKEQILNQNK